MSKDTDTKTKLLDAAERAARAQGHDGFSYADLARVVGIRKASIHHHFPSKSDLLAALIARYRTAAVATYTVLDAGYATAGGRLRGFVSMHRGALQGTETLCLCVALSVGREGLNDAAQTEMATFRTVTLNWLTSVFRQGARDGTISNVGEPAAEAAAALAIAEGAQISARADRDMARFDAAVALLLGRVI